MHPYSKYSCVWILSLSIAYMIFIIWYHVTMFTLFLLLHSIFFVEINRNPLLNFIVDENLGCFQFRSLHFMLLEIYTYTHTDMQVTHTHTYSNYVFPISQIAFIK